MISTARSSLARAAPTRPGSRWASGRMRLKRCVAWRAPAPIASCASSNVAPERNPHAARDERARELQPAGNLRRERDDSDVRTPAIDHPENIVRREAGWCGSGALSRRLRLNSGSLRGYAQAAEWLRAAEFR